MKIRVLALSILLLTSGMAASVPVNAAGASSVAGKSAQVELASGSAIVVDLQTGKVIYSLNPDKKVPIASITKLMTAMVVLDAKQSLDEIIPVYIEETKELVGVRSRLKVGSEMSRKDMMLLTLMSSENRAAASLAHNYPGGQRAFIAAMNAKAASLGMRETRYVEPTGLSTDNVSTAKDLSLLLIATKHYPLISELSTSTEKSMDFTKPVSYSLGFRNTNHLVYNDKWNIELTKTGYTDKAGHCLAMRTVINDRPVALVVLDAFGKYTHFADASRLRKWMETGEVVPVPAAAKSYRVAKDRKLVSVE